MIRRREEKSTIFAAVGINSRKMQRRRKNEDIVTMEEPKCDEALSPEDNSEDTIERSSLG